MQEARAPNLALYSLATHLRPKTLDAGWRKRPSLRSARIARKRFRQKCSKGGFRASLLPRRCRQEKDPPEGRVTESGALALVPAFEFVNPPPRTARVRPP